MERPYIKNTPLPPQRGLRPRNAPVFQNTFVPKLDEPFPRMDQLMTYKRQSVTCIFFMFLFLMGCTNQPRSASSYVVPDYESQQAASREAIDSEPPLEEPVARPQENRLVRLAIIADINGSYGTDQYDSDVIRSIDMIIEDRPDIVINAGDMVAGQKPKLNYRKMWAGFHTTVTERLLEAGIPMAQVPGNHDASAYPAFAVERETYIDEWNTHKPDLDYVDDSHYPLYYAFRVNGILFIGLDATTLDPLDDEQYAWLEHQLKSNPTPYPAVIIQHVPLYPITTIKPKEILRDARLHPLYAQYGVQLIIAGHQQAYFPARLDGVTYIHSGALGGGPRPVRQNNGVDPKTLTFIDLYPRSAPYIDTRLIVNGREQPFNHNLLPTYIVFDDKILPRVDIRYEDAKYARDYLISPHMTKSQMLTLIDALKDAKGDWSKLPEWK